MTTNSLLTSCCDLAHALVRPGQAVSLTITTIPRAPEGGASPPAISPTHTARADLGGESRVAHGTTPWAAIAALHVELVDAAREHSARLTAALAMTSRLGSERPIDPMRARLVTEGLASLAQAEALSEGEVAETLRLWDLDQQRRAREDAQSPSAPATPGPSVLEMHRVMEQGRRNREQVRPVPEASLPAKPSPPAQRLILGMPFGGDVGRLRAEGGLPPIVYCRTPEEVEAAMGTPAASVREAWGPERVTQVQVRRRPASWSMKEQLGLRGAQSSAPQVEVRQSVTSSAPAAQTGELVKDGLGLLIHEPDGTRRAASPDEREAILGVARRITPLGIVGDAPAPTKEPALDEARRPLTTMEQAVSQMRPATPEQAHAHQRIVHLHGRGDEPRTKLVNITEAPVPADEGRTFRDFTGAHLPATVSAAALQGETKVTIPGLEEAVALGIGSILDDIQARKGRARANAWDDLDEREEQELRDYWRDIILKTIIAKVQAAPRQQPTLPSFDWARFRIANAGLATLAETKTWSDEKVFEANKAMDVMDVVGSPHPLNPDLRLEGITRRYRRVHPVAPARPRHPAIVPTEMVVTDDGDLAARAAPEVPTPMVGPVPSSIDPDVVTFSQDAAPRCITCGIAGCTDTHHP